MYDTFIDKNGNELTNATGYELKLNENGKITVVGLRPGQIISVNTGWHAEKMLVVSIDRGYISCDNDGIERTVMLSKIGDVILFRDVTD